MSTEPRKIVNWPIEKLVPYEKNAKIHDEAQVQSLAQAIKKFGWTQPIVIESDGTIIAGHGRRLAALHLGMKFVPVDVRSDLSKAEAAALRLADNRVTSTSYDQAAIQAELQALAKELEGSEIEITDLGFTEKELDFSLSDLGEIDASFFTSDISAAVEEQKAKNTESIKTTDDTAAPVADALGFKRLSISQSRTLKTLMLQVEAVTESTGPDALISFLADALADSHK